MRIVRKAGPSGLAGRLQGDIEHAAGSPRPAGRICTACDMICAQCGSATCQCACSPRCPEAARALSSEPEVFPVEPGIVGLVYALTTTGLFSPCWSCEGHPHADGSFWKAPSVWFYCDSTSHLRLLADSIGRLEAAQLLHGKWRVGVAYSDPDNPEPTFALEPDLAARELATLQELQADAAVMAESLPGLIASEGRKLQKATRMAFATAASDGRSASHA